MCIFNFHKNEKKLYLYCLYKNLIFMELNIIAIYNLKLISFINIIFDETKRFFEMKQLRNSIIVFFYFHIKIWEIKHLFIQKSVFFSFFFSIINFFCSKNRKTYVKNPDTFFLEKKYFLVHFLKKNRKKNKKWELILMIRGSSRKGS